MTRAQDVDGTFVADKRAMGASWGAIARMAGCSEVDLRREHDLGFKKVAADVIPRRAESPRDVVAKALRRAGATRDEATVLARLWMANGARCRSDDLARGIAGGGAAQDVCKEAKKTAKRLGIAFADGPTGFALAAAGVVRISELAGHPRGRP